MCIIVSTPIEIYHPPKRERFNQTEKFTTQRIQSDTTVLIK